MSKAARTSPASLWLLCPRRGGAQALRFGRRRGRHRPAAQPTRSCSRNVIVKAKNNTENHTVIHFGQDVGHDRNGTLYLVHNTIVTPFISPVVDLSAPHVRARLIDNLIWDGGSSQQQQMLVKNRTGSNAGDLVTGQNNFFCGGFGPQGTLGVSVPAAEAPPFVLNAKTITLAGPIPCVSAAGPQLPDGRFTVLSDGAGHSDNRTSARSSSNRDLYLLISSWMAASSPGWLAGPVLLQENRPAAHQWSEVIVVITRRSPA